MAEKVEFAMTYQNMVIFKTGRYSPYKAEVTGSIPVPPTIVVLTHKLSCEVLLVFYDNCSLPLMGW